MDNFLPDMYQKNIYKINYKILKHSGIKCLLFDLNNTLVPCNEERPNTKLINFMEILKDDFKIIILSNSNKNRLIHFKEKLNVDVAYNSLKPLKKKYKKIMKLYKYKEYQIACIGDQILTDVLGSNRMGFFSILVNPVSENEDFITKISRRYEKKIINKLHKKGLFEKDSFYE